MSRLICSVGYSSLGYILRFCDNVAYLCSFVCELEHGTVLLSKVESYCTAKGGCVKSIPWCCTDRSETSDVTLLYFYL